jgi:hypothetical protein
MKIKAITSSFANAPHEVVQSGWSRECDPGITEGREYTVYAISVFRQPIEGFTRLINFQIVDDTNGVTWLPSFLFDVVDRSLPPDWECNLLPSGILVIGPTFITESDEALQAMGDQEPEAMQKFRARQQEIESQTE